MKNLSDYIKEDGIAPSLGAQEAASTFSTPGNTMGMGDLKPPTYKEPGSGDLMGKTNKEKDIKKKKKKEDKNEKEEQ